MTMRSRAAAADSRARGLPQRGANKVVNIDG